MGLVNKQNRVYDVVTFQSVAPRAPRALGATGVHVWLTAYK